MSSKTARSTRARSSRTADPLPPVLKVRPGFVWDDKRGKYIRLRSFPAKLGEALVLKAGEPVAYGGREKHLMQSLLVVRKEINRAIRLLKQMGV